MVYACPSCPHASRSRRCLKNHLFFMHRIRSAGVSTHRLQLFIAEGC